MNEIMENNIFGETTRKIARLVLNNQQKMTRKDDLKNLCGSLNFDEVLIEVDGILSKLGFDFFSTSFLGQEYYVLTSEGKDDNITPSQYGALALIIALSKEVDKNIKFDDLKEIFAEVWDIDVQFLINKDYLRVFDELGIIIVTPLGKAIMKNILPDLDLKNLLEALNTKNQVD